MVYQRKQSLQAHLSLPKWSFFPLSPSSGQWLILRLNPPGAPGRVILSRIPFMWRMFWKMQILACYLWCLTCCTPKGLKREFLWVFLPTYSTHLHLPFPPQLNFSLSWQLESLRRQLLKRLEQAFFTSPCLVIPSKHLWALPWRKLSLMLLPSVKTSIIFLLINSNMSQK